jgi:adenylate kinase
MRPIVLSGYMSAGKSTVARDLAQRGHLEVLSFGDLVRDEAERRGGANDRDSLQHLGQALMKELGAAGMVDHLIGQRTSHLVIDGVRHIDVLEELSRRMPDLVFAFFIAPENVLIERWQKRGDAGSRAVAVNHPVEAELGQLRERAALVLDTSRLSKVQIGDILLRAAVD